MTGTTSPVIRSLQRRLSQRLEDLPAAHVQNVLMRSTDRSLALALLGGENHLEHAVFDRISTRKADRVRSELAVLERKRVSNEYCRDALAQLLGALESNAKADGRASYWRPRARGAT